MSATPELGKITSFPIPPIPPIPVRRIAQHSPNHLGILLPPQPSIQQAIEAISPNSCITEETTNSPIATRLKRRATSDTRTSPSATSPIRRSIHRNQPSLESLSKKRNSFLSRPRLRKSGVLGARGTVISGGSGEKGQDHPPNAPKFRLGQIPTFWQGYNKTAELDDEEFVRTLNLSLDSLLIFAGLFSGINTAFIVESLSTVQPDQVHQTNDLIRSLILTLQNSTVSDSLVNDEAFEAPAQAVRSTTFFSASLCCSLTAAFGAIIGKQWLDHYQRKEGHKEPYHQGQERQRKYDASKRWHLEGVIQTLPTILQFSLFLFLVAMFEFLAPINTTVAFVTASLSLIPVSFYFVTTTISILSPDCPFQTRFSISARESTPKLIRYLKQRGMKALDNAEDRVDRLPQPFRSLCTILIFTLAAPFSLLWYSTQSIFRLLSRRSARKEQDENSGGQIASLDLRCLLYYVTKASTPEDTNALLVALYALPNDLLRLTRDHPLIQPLFNALLKFLLKPTWDSRNNRVVWGSASIEFQPLINILHLTYVEWRCYLNFSSIMADAVEPDLRSTDAVGLQQLIRHGLWEVFFNDLQNLKQTAHIAEIMEATRSVEGDCDETKVDRLCQAFISPETDPVHYPSYISLLSHSPLRHLSTCSQNPRFGQITSWFLSTMSVRDVVAAEYWLGGVQAVWMSANLADMGPDDKYQFSETLLAWWQAFNSDHAPVTRWYLFAVSTLLHSSPHNHLWPQQLERDGHLELLLQIMDSGRDSATAISCFITLWHRQRATPGEDKGRSAYLTPRAVAIIVNEWAYLHITPRLQEEGVLTPEQITMFMEQTVSYLEAASWQGLLNVEMESIIRDYKAEADICLNSDPHRQQALYDRLARLEFVQRVSQEEQLSFME